MSTILVTISGPDADEIHPSGVEKILEDALRDHWDVTVIASGWDV